MNYDKKMMEIISSLDKIPKILLHSCCAPCSSACIDRLKDYFDITVLYYNPNIEPIEEYLKRKEEQKTFLKKLNSKNEINFLDCDYNNERFTKLIDGLHAEKERGSRCKVCYRERLEYTAKMAKEKGFDYFGTTLSVSPYKVTSWINEIGLELEKEFNIKFLVADFKKQDGYKKSIEFSKKFNLYRQDYCGCKYSKKERMYELIRKNVTNIMDTIEYGYIDSKSNKYIEIFEDFSDKYILQSPKELLESKIGVCWDQVELERDLFSKLDFIFETYFLVHYDNVKCPTHTFLIFTYDDKFYWYEHSWEKYKGIKEYQTKEDALIDIQNKFIETELNNDYNKDNLVMYKYRKPSYGLDCLSFYKHCESGEQVIV